MPIYIYIYRFGTKQYVASINQKFKAIEPIISPHKIVLGPSDSEHELLYKKYKTYKNAIDNCKYAFAADVWRCFKAAKTRTNYFYMDANTLIDPIRFKTFLNSLLKYKYFFIFEANTIVWNGVFYCNNKHDRIFKYYLKLYKNVFHTFEPIGPLILTYAIFSKISKKTYFNDCLIKDTRFVDYRQDNFIKNNSSGSWIDNKNFDIQQWWGDNFDYFIQNPLIVNDNQYKQCIEFQKQFYTSYFKKDYKRILIDLIPKHIKKLLKKVFYTNK